MNNPASPKLLPDVIYASGPENSYGLISGYWDNDEDDGGEKYLRSAPIEAIMKLLGPLVEARYAFGMVDLDFITFKDEQKKFYRLAANTSAQIRDLLKGMEKK